MNQPSKIIKNKCFGAVLVFLISFGVYLKTLAPTIYIQDTAEFITAAYSLGIPHPSGYPLYVLLGKLFTFLPLGSIAFRVNLMSAFWGALVAGGLYLILNYLIHNKIISFVSALIWAFSPIFWSQAAIAEVYTLNIFLLALNLGFLILWQKTQKPKWFYLWAFIYGLSLTNHLSLILLLPAFLVFIFWEKEMWRKGKMLVKGLILVVLGLSVYLYLPLASLANPTLDFGNTENWSNFVNHVTRKSYQEIDWGLASVFNQGKIPLIGTFLEDLTRQFGSLLVGLGIWGFYQLFRKNKRLALMTFLIFIATSFGIIFLSREIWSFEILETYQLFYLPAYFMMVLWIGWGLSYLWKKLFLYLPKLKTRFLKNLVVLILISILLLLPLSLAIKNYSEDDWSQYYLAYDYGKNILESLEKNAILVIEDEGIMIDIDPFTLIYFQVVEKLRPDVTIITNTQIYPPPQDFNLPGNYYSLTEQERRSKLFKEVVDKIGIKEKRPIYTTFLVDNLDESNYVSGSNGMVYKVYSNYQEVLENSQKAKKYNLRNLVGQPTSISHFSQDLLARNYYLQSSYYLEQGDLKKSHLNLLKAIELDNQVFSHDYQSFIYHRGQFLAATQ